MRACSVLLLLTGSLVLLSDGHAQPPFQRGPIRIGQQEAADISRYWIRSYFRRDASPEEVRLWAGQLQNARDPAEALSALLASREYLRLSGGTRPGYIRQLVLDVGHHEPNEYEMQNRLERSRGMDFREIASRFLEEHPANWWPGPEATPPRELERGRYGD